MSSEDDTILQQFLILRIKCQQNSDPATSTTNYTTELFQAFQSYTKTPMSAENLMIAVGEHDTTDWEVQKNHRVHKVHVHSKFNPQSMINTSTDMYDYAVLELECHQKIHFGRMAQPACLPKRGDHLKYMNPGTVFNVSGWGSQDDMIGPNYSPSPILKVGQLQYTQHQEESHSTMFASDIDESGHAVCAGDSGGPLTWKDGNKWKVVGINSASFNFRRDENGNLKHLIDILPEISEEDFLKCNRKELAFAIVENQLDWIEAIVKNCKCGGDRQRSCGKVCSTRH